MVLIVRYDPLSIDSRGGEVRLVLVRPDREVEGVVVRDPTIEEVSRLIVGRRSELLPSGSVVPGLVAVGILKLRHDEGRSRLY